MSAKIDLTGQRFGKLVVLAPTEKRTDGGSIVWKCQCDCGRQAEVSAKRLAQGKVRSCGCLSNPPHKDYIGKRFGRLTVVEYVGNARELDKTGSANYWRCRCDCGGETVVNQTALQNGSTQSCGCLQKERAAEGLVLLEGTSVAILERIHDSPPRKNNTSGHTGVFQRKNGTWLAYINFRKKRYYLGHYASMEDAIKARQRGEEMHENFLEWYYENCSQKKSCEDALTPMNMRK